MNQRLTPTPTGHRLAPVVHTVNLFTQQEDGTYHITGHILLAGVKAVGQTTGAEYVVPAASEVVEIYVSPARQSTAL